MKVSELRIGNLVKHASSGKTCIIEGIYESGIMTSFLSEKGSVTGGIQFFEPIPITAEWLRKFGFVIVTKSTLLSIFRVKNDDIAFNLSKKSSLRYKNTFISCVYVHQLQNLFFALTGEELTLKTKSK